MSGMDLTDAIVLFEETSLMGEPAEDLQRGIDAGVLYVCDKPDGLCSNGRHVGGAFLHLCPGKTEDDYDVVLFPAECEACCGEGRWTHDFGDGVAREIECASCDGHGRSLPRA